jgi:hypothetical protein
VRDGDLLGDVQIAGPRLCTARGRSGHGQHAQRVELRLLDRVAVKGKTRAIEIYELLGSLGRRRTVVEQYEAALAAYFAFRAATVGLDRRARLHHQVTLLKLHRHVSRPRVRWQRVSLFREAVFLFCERTSPTPGG